MKACEAKSGKQFTMAIAHHSFINPLALRNVIQRRKREGLPQIPLYCFVHGTALKMYRWELGPKQTEEQKTFPMRFHKMIVQEKLFDDQVNGVNACFDQRGAKRRHQGNLPFIPSKPCDCCSQWHQCGEVQASSEEPESSDGRANEEDCLARRSIRERL